MNKIITGIVIAAVAVLALICIRFRYSVFYPNTAGDNSTSFQNGLIVGGGVYAVSPAMTVIGSASQNGLLSTTSRQSLVSGTTTPCAILTPTATSSLVFFDVNITTPTSTAQTWSIATSTSFNATTSVLGQFAVPASVQIALPWYPSGPLVGSSAAPANPASSTLGIIAPSIWIVAGTTGGAGSGSGTVIGGTCQAEFYIL